ncbi:tripartite motif-containing protein 5-like [Gigantopelta aegis]|uniref:tripartite motif-containing protein 5-like n=1 Tax=Gigantopelta aegis TaxID=1735272 RepID=UPI001B88A665|nr:tripartite motif-containing protein 5-like [Gigantopelta aegis]
MASSVCADDDDISCSLCMEVFSDPRTVPCGHTFCRACLQNLFNANKKAHDVCPCPVCRKAVHIPDRTKPVSSCAGQFPRNVALVQAIDTINKLKQRDAPTTSTKTDHLKQNMKAICENLEWFNEILKNQMKSEIKRLDNSVRTSTLQTADEIDRRGDEIVTAVRDEQARMKKELHQCQLATNSEIWKLFTQHKTVIDEGNKVVKLGSHLIQSGSVSDIEKNISKFMKLQKITSDFVDTARSLAPVPDLKVTVAPSRTASVVSIGEVSPPDIRSLIETRARILDISGILPDRKTDKLIQAGAFSTQAKDALPPGIQCILVLEGERSNTIVVTDCFNVCVKCFCAETSALHSKYEVFGAPCGLAESRDQQVAVVLPIEHQILFLTLRDDIRLSKTLRTDKRYYYISMLPDNRMAVTGGSSLSHENRLGKYVDVLDEEGRVIQSLLCDINIEPWCLAMKGDSLVVVSDSRTLASVTSSGEITWVKQDTERLHHLRGITCDVEEFVYVCDDARSCLVQLSRDGEIIRDILTCQDGLTEPLYVCCDQHKLYVAQSNGEVKIFMWSKD